MCESCKYRDDNPDDFPRHPCNHCIFWGDDGYLEYREYVYMFREEVEEDERNSNIHQIL